MNGMVRLGPLAFAADRLLAVALILAFIIALDRITARAGNGSAPVTGLAIVAGIVAARLAYVAAHFEAYSHDWGSVLAVWQGGFLASAGLLAAAAVIAWRMRPRRAMAEALGALAVAAGCWFVGSALLKPDPLPLPELPTLTRLDGATLELGDFRDQPHVINLWATWCPPCRRELPMLAEVASETPVPILLVNQGEPADVVRAYLDERRVAAEAVVLDPRSNLSRLLEGEGLPTTLFVDAQGRVVETHVGEISRAALLAEIAGLEEH